MKKAPATDPRFDPRFQRGYGGPEPVPPAAPSPLSPPAPVVKRPVDEPQPIDGAGISPDGGDVEGGDPDAFWTPPRRNPFALALLVGGVAMIAVGGWLVWSVVTASSYPNGYDRGEQAFALIQQQLTPALLICGALGIVGWLVLGALAASARKGD